jgi:putative membrane-bound dehydrogenase-like protein
MRRLAAVSLLLAAFAVVSAAPTKDACKPPEEFLKTFKFPEGLEVTCFAQEPGCINPTDMDIDERGRVWWVESMNYRGSKLRPEGDRIMIAEDTKGEGKADSYKVFYQGTELVGPLGITVLGNKVYVAQSPKMWVFTIDASGDKPVGPPEVLFDGFSGVNHDHGLHSIMFGPDGRFYFNAGNEGCNSLQLKNGKGEIVIDSTGSEVGGKGQKWRGGPRGGAGKHYTQGMAFRCNPDGTDFEVLGYNFRNNYEVASDSFGTAWQSDNDDDGNQGVRINYVMEGGNYGYVGLKGSGWSRDMPSHPGQTKQEAHWHQRDPGMVPNLLMTGGGAPCGICIYEGDLLPEAFRGKIIHCDAGPNVVRVYSPTPAGAGYKCESSDLLFSTDRWFRPCDVCVGVDGSVYIADWTDPGVGGHATGDRDPKTISGRIYRIAPKGHKPVVPKLDLSTVEGQIQALLSPNLARRYLGYQKLAASLEKASPALEKVFLGSTNPRHRARALWLLARGPKGADWIAQGLKDKDVDLRVTAFRAARLVKMDMIALSKQMLADGHPFMNREICLAMNYQPTSAALDILVALADRVIAPSPDQEFPTDAKDDGKFSAEKEKIRQNRYVPRWYLEAFGIACIGREKEVLEAWEKNGKNKDPKVAEFIAWRLNGVLPDAAPKEKGQ